MNQHIDCFCFIEEHFNLDTDYLSWHAQTCGLHILSMFACLIYITMHTAVFQPLYTSSCVRWHPQIRTGGCCWSEVVLPTCHCWWWRVHLELGKDSIILNNVTYLVSIPNKYGLLFVTRVKYVWYCVAHFQECDAHLHLQQTTPGQICLLLLFIVYRLGMCWISAVALAGSESRHFQEIGQIRLCPH